MVNRQHLLYIHTTKSITCTHIELKTPNNAVKENPITTMDFILTYIKSHAEMGTAMQMTDQDKTVVANHCQVPVVVLQLLFLFLQFLTLAWWACQPLPHELLLSFHYHHTHRGRSIDRTTNAKQSENSRFLLSRSTTCFSLW